MKRVYILPVNNDDSLHIYTDRLFGINIAYIWLDIFYRTNFSMESDHGLEKSEIGNIILSNNLKRAHNEKIKEIL